MLKNYTHTEGINKASLVEKYINDWDVDDTNDTVEIFQRSVGLLDHKITFPEEVVSYKHNFATLRGVKSNF